MGLTANHADTTDRVDYGTVPPAQFGRLAPFTVSFYASGLNYNPLSGVGVLASYAANITSIGWIVYLNSTGYLTFSFIGASGNAVLVLNAIDRTSQPQAHFAVVYDGSSTAAGVQMYKDGVALALLTVFDTLTAEPSYTGASMMVANGTGLADVGASGTFHEFAVWDTNLSAATVGMLASGSNPLYVSPSMPIHYSKLDTTPTVSDLSGNDYHGTNTGMVLDNTANPTVEAGAARALSAWIYKRVERWRETLSNRISG